MARSRALEVEFPKVDPTAGDWVACRDEVFAGEIRIADCSLPSCNIDKAHPIDEVERRRWEARANAHVMARAKEALELLAQIRPTLDDVAGLLTDEGDPEGDLVAKNAAQLRDQVDKLLDAVEEGR